MFELVAGQVRGTKVDVQYRNFWFCHMYYSFRVTLRIEKDNNFLVRFGKICS